MTEIRTMVAYMLCVVTERRQDKIQGGNKNVLNLDYGTGYMSIL